MLIDQPSETLDGVHVPLYVNTGLLQDITPSIQSGAEGVGLYRTEIPFLMRDGFPGEGMALVVGQLVVFDDRSVFVLPSSDSQIHAYSLSVYTSPSQQKNGNSCAYVF